ncbi:MAG: hypothetical protein ACTSWE_14160, partial [Promethearchaeota archaeon]
MRIRTRKNLIYKNIIISFLLALPVIGFFSYIGIGLYILDDVASFTLNLDPPNTSYFYPLNQILGNQTYLRKMADTYDWQLEKWHIPT